MAIADICRSFFASVTRNRGHRYFASRRVHLGKVSARRIVAEVSGSGRTPYSVEIDWSRDAGGNVVASCSCPHYAGGFLCKHIWATLLKIDHVGLADELTVRKGKVRRDDRRGDDSADGDDRGAAASSAAEPADLSGTRDAFNRVSSAAGRASRRGLPSALWQFKLSEISRYAAAQGSTRSGNALDQREAWFVLNVSESLSTGDITVDLRQRLTRANGEPGEIKTLQVSSGRIPEFASDEDEGLIKLLMGNPPSEQTYTPFYQDLAFRPFSRVAVAPAMYEVLLPRLCATGRFVWQLDSSLPTEEGTAICWDDGPPWRFRLGVESDTEAQHWRFFGKLQRGELVVPLSDAVLLWASGLVLFSDRLARFELPRGDFGWIASLRAQASIEVPYSDRDRLLKALYRMPQLPEIDLPESLRVEEVRAAPQGRSEIRTPDVRDHHFRTKLLARIGFVYDDHQFHFHDRAIGRFDPETNRAILRDRPREAELLAPLADLGLCPSSVTYSRSASDFFFAQNRLPEVVERLTAAGWIVESAAGVRIRPPGAFQLNVTSHVDWFELNGQVDFAGVSAALPDLLQALRNKQQFIRLGDGSQGMLPQAWLQRYSRLAEMAEGDGASLRFAPSQTLLLDALLAEQEDVQVDAGFSAFRDKLRGFAGVKPSSEPRGFHGTLRQYQKEGLGWLHFLREFRLGGCLADDMGLGKTIQVLALLQSRRLKRRKKDEDRKPSIVVVPKSLVFNWIDEAARFTPRLRVFNYTGTDRRQRLESNGGFDLLVTTYGTLRRDIVALREMQFDYAVLDESQAVKNHNSQAAKASRLLGADHRLAMTGTPIENHLGELWSLFEFLNPGMLGRSATFNALAKNGKDSQSLAAVAQAVRPFLLRRTKEQVLKELPEKTEQTLYCDMTPKQRKDYDELRNYYRLNLTERVRELGLDKAKIHVLEALLRLRQAACHPGLLHEKKKNELSPKLETLLGQLREVMEEGHKALVFSQFTSLLSIVRHHLDKDKVAYEYLDGRTRKRGEKVKRFQTDDACQLFLISLKAGGYGLNLTAADYVFILDPWWNPAVESQAIDRAHRIGQTRSVFAYRIICRDTVEDKILELQKSKRDLADAIVSADNSLIRSLTAEDLELLLS